MRIDVEVDRTGGAPGAVGAVETAGQAQFAPVVGQVEVHVGGQTPVAGGVAGAVEAQFRAGRALSLAEEEGRHAFTADG